MRIRRRECVLGGTRAYSTRGEVDFLGGSGAIDGLEIGAVVAGSYLLGAVPFGVLISTRMGVDISRVGSGSTGATNVSRALGWRWALVVLLLDALKGYVPTATATWLATENQTTYGLVAGCAAILGHCASPFLRFRGGKGIATGLGMLLAAIPWVGLAALGIFLAMMAVCRIVSLSSLIATASLAPLAWAWGLPREDVAILAFLAIFVAYRHRSNIGRLLRGEEPKLGLHTARSKGNAPLASEQSVTLSDASFHQNAASNTSKGGAGAK